MVPKTFNRTISVAEALALEAAMCQKSISAFTQRGFKVLEPATEYKHNWHLDCLSEYLHAVHTGEIRKLIINVPPRSLKSISVSICFPAWLLGVDPASKIICASYGHNLSLGLGVKTRRLIKSEWYQRIFPDTVIAADQNEKRKFETTEYGHRISTSVGAGITGEGGDYLIVDDPTDPLQALSDTERATANTWFDQTFYSRQNDKKTSRIIVVMQRLHTDDLSGHLLEKGDYEHLCLPVYAPEKKTIHIGNKSWTVEKGELLHPDREGRAEIDQLRRGMTEYGFAGQYMQTPAPKGGGEFKHKWIQYYDKAPDPRTMNVYILVDPANEKKKESDYTAFMVVGLGRDQNYYLLDVIRDKFNPTERVNTMFNLHRKWTAMSGKPPKVGYEKYGMMADTHYIEERKKQEGYNFPLVEVGGRMSKEDRIRQLIPVFEQERVYFPTHLMYTDYTGVQCDLIHALVHGEMLTFPVGMHPDMLDALARIMDENMCALFPRVQVNRGMAVTRRDNSQSEYGFLDV